MIDDRLTTKSNRAACLHISYGNVPHSALQSWKNSNLPYSQYYLTCCWKQPPTWSFNIIYIYIYIRLSRCPFSLGTTVLAFFYCGASPKPNELFGLIHSTKIFQRRTVQYCTVARHVGSDSLDWLIRFIHSFDRLNIGVRSIDPTFIWLTPHTTDTGFRLWYTMYNK
jgi:hypothetical protein